MTGISVSRIAIALAPAAIAVLAMSAAVIGARRSLMLDSDVLRLGVQIGVGAIVYIATVAALGWRTLVPSLRSVLTNLRR